MALWIALGFALVGGLLDPFASRLQATGLWAGKALAPPETASAFPRGIQDALTGGWPSMLPLAVTALPYTAAAIGFFHAWWAGLLALFTALLTGAIAGRTSIAPRTLDYYLAHLTGNAHRRSADYALKGDAQRAEIMKETAQELQGLLANYVGSGVPAPTLNEACRTPHGEPDYFLKMYCPTMNPEKMNKSTHQHEKISLSMAWLRDLAATPDDAVKIIEEYSEAVAENPSSPKLPYPKDTIKQAIEVALNNAQDTEMRQSLQRLLFYLETFSSEQAQQDSQEKK